MSAMCACASLERTNSARLGIGGPAPAPRGVVALCTANPTSCGMSSAENASLAERRAQARMQAFSDLMRARVEASRSSRARAASGAQIIAHMTPEDWAMLVEVDAEINAAITPVEDTRRNGVSDYWEMPVFDEEGRSQGDCEEYALAKRARLIEAGWSPEVLRLAAVVAPGVGAHAVLVVLTDQGDYVLDNLAGAPTRVDRTGYQWVAVQGSAQFNDWRVASVLSQSRRAHGVTVLSTARTAPRSTFVSVASGVTTQVSAMPETATASVLNTSLMY